MRCKVDVLVCVCGFQEDIKLKMSVRFARNVDVQHVNVAVLCHFLGQFDVRIDGVDVGK